jgi:predicted RNA-binding Zn-ribbon protein involved in translation (DUF1610 family)
MTQIRCPECGASEVYADDEGREKDDASVDR